MNEEVYNQIAAIVQAAMGGDKKAEQQIAQIMQAAEQGDQQAKQLAAVIQEIAGKIQKAKFGAKLVYISSLNGKCPEGYEVEKFMSGGCVKCAKKKIKKYQTGKQIKQPFTGFEDIEYFYEAPVISRQGRAERPEVETLSNKNSDNYYSGAFMSKEGYYDADVYENEGRRQYVEGEPIYLTRHNSGWKESTDTEERAFNHLKRHALNNRAYDEDAMWQRAEAMKMINSLSPIYKKRF